MIRDIAQYKGHYSILALLAAFFIAYFVYAQNRPAQLFLAAIIFAFLYIAWGIWHHTQTRSLTRTVVLEYFLVALIGLVIVSSLLL